MALWKVGAGAAGGSSGDGAGCRGRSRKPPGTKGVWPTASDLSKAVVLLVRHVALGGLMARQRIGHGAVRAPWPMGRRGPGSSAGAGRPARRSATRRGAAGGRDRPPARWPRVAGTAVTPPPTIGPPSTPRHPRRSGAIRIPPAKPGQSGFCIFRVPPALGPPAGIRPRAVGSAATGRGRPLGGKGADARQSKSAVISCFGSAAGAPFRAENWAALT